MRRRRVLVVTLLLAFGLCAAIVGARGRALAAWLRGEGDLAGNPRYLPAHPVDRAALGRIDLERLHAELIPDWAAAAAANGERGGRARAAAALAAVLAAVAPDANLTALFTELAHRVARSPLRDAARIDWLVWAWSDYLDRAGLPWRLEGGVRLGGGRASFVAKTYHSTAELRVTVGERPYRARLLERADWTNVYELYLGEASRADEGALVVVDRVRDFAVERVWPLLDASIDATRTPLDRAFAAAIRAEVAAALPPRSVAVLRDTAPAHWTVREAVEAIHFRHRCGSDLVVEIFPWEGLPPAGRALLRRAALGDHDPICPEVTAGEAKALIGASERLEHAERLVEALEGLVAWLARGVTVHESRHAADDDRADGLRTPLDCRGCPGGLDTGARAELSAYLASFAAPGTGYASLFQACEMEDEEGTPHAAALAFVRARLGTGGCKAAPPSDLYARARDLEESLFDRAEAISLPASFPRRLHAFPE